MIISYFRGLLYEPRNQFGLAYRTRKSMQNQAAALNASYTAAQLSPPLVPGYDDQLTRNDVTVTPHADGLATVTVA